MLHSLTLASILRGQNDWLVGMNYSRALGIGAGRVRTTALAMVVHRYDEIDNFIQKTVYEIDDYFNEGFKAVLQTVGKERIKDKTGNMVEKTTYASTQFDFESKALEYIRENLK